MASIARVAVWAELVLKPALSLPKGLAKGTCPELAEGSQTLSAVAGGVGGVPNAVGATGRPPSPAEGVGVEWPPEHDLGGTGELDHSPGGGLAGAAHLGYDTNSRGVAATPALVARLLSLRPPASGLAPRVSPAVTPPGAATRSALSRTDPRAGRGTHRPSLDGAGVPQLPCPGRLRAQRNVTHRGAFRAKTRAPQRHLHQKGRQRGGLPDPPATYWRWRPIFRPHERCVRTHAGGAVCLELSTVSVPKYR